MDLAPGIEARGSRSRSDDHISARVPRNRGGVHGVRRDPAHAGTRAPS